MRMPNSLILTGLADEGAYSSARYLYYLKPIIDFPDDISIVRYSKITRSLDYLIVKRSFLKSHCVSPCPVSFRLRTRYYLD